MFRTRARFRPLAARLSAAALLLAVWVAVAAPLRAAELVMFEAALCPWCAAWDAQIGTVYPKTAEGRAAPLRKVALHGARPQNLIGIKGIRYSPTFVLVEGDREVGRIEGYPGEDHFWGLLGELLARLESETAFRQGESEEIR